MPDKWPRVFQSSREDEFFNLAEESNLVNEVVNFCELSNFPKNFVTYIYKYKEDNTYKYIGKIFGKLESRLSLLKREIGSGKIIELDSLPHKVTTALTTLNMRCANGWFSEDIYRRLTNKNGPVDSADYLRELSFENILLDSFYAGYYREWGLDPYMRTFYGWCRDYRKLMAQYFPQAKNLMHAFIGTRGRDSKYWPKIVKARRLADEAGITYEDWIEGVMKHYWNDPLPKNRVTHPGFFCTDKAQKIAIDFLDEKYGASCRDLHKIVFEPHEHDLEDPIQRRHYTNMLEDLRSEAKWRNIAFVEILAEAVKKGALPEEIIKQKCPGYYNDTLMRLIREQHVPMTRRAS